MKKYKFNANHNRDHLTFKAGCVYELPENAAALLSTLDIFGMPLKEGSEQKPLITETSEEVTEEKVETETAG